MRYLGLILAPALILAGALYGYRMALVLEAGSGYAAKNICSGHFLSGFEPQLIINQALVGASPLLAHISFQINTHERQVTTRLFGLYPRIAQFNSGVGCTLLPSDTTNNAPKIKALKAPAFSPGDRWRIAEVNDSARRKLSNLLDSAFLESNPGSPKNTKAIVIVHEGRLVAERYSKGVGINTPLIGWSMTKSVTNLLVGILVKDGVIDISAPAPVPVWHINSDDQRREITVNQLLRMSSGLSFDEEYGLYSDVTRMLSNEADMASFAASKPLDSDVGTRWSYSSGTSNILAGIIREAIGGSAQKVYEFTQERLFYPIGIRTASIEVDASGTFIGSSYMYASARDWARLGLLCLNNGLWNNQQILPANWMEYSTTAAPANSKNHYGAHFWLNQDPEDKTSQRVFASLPTDTFAMDGYQGQMVVMVPSENLIVVRLGFTPHGNHGVEALVSGAIEVLRKEQKESFTQSHYSE